jgi:hypothetical protein
MAITINTTPTEVALAGNALPFNVTSNNALTSSGSRAKWTIGFGADAPEHGQYFILSSDLFELEFEFRSSPDNSGNQLPVPAVPWVPATYSAIMRAAMAKNYYLARYCDIIPVENSANFIIQFRDLADHDIAFDQPGGYITCSVTEGANTVLKPNFRIGVLVHSGNTVIGEDDKAPVLPSVAQLLANQSSVTLNFDIADYVRHLASGGFTYPIPELFTQLVVWPAAIVPFFVSFFEKYGSVPEPQALVSSSVCYALPGGIDRTMLETIENDWFTDYLSEKHFLTWADDERWIYDTDIIRLFFCLKNAGNVYLKMKYGYYGETNFESEWLAAGDPVICTSWSIVEAIIDPARLLTAEQLSVANYYAVKLVDASGNDVSQTRRFNLFDSVPAQRLQFVFANSYEVAYDSLFATGKSEFNVEMESYESISINKNKAQSRSKRTERMSVNTGFINFRTLFFWQEFLQSQERWLIRDGRKIPVRVLSTVIYLFKNREYNYALGFEIEIDNADAFRSSLPDASLFSDFFNSNGYQSVVVSNSGGGHIIINASNQAMGQRSKLKFTGDGVTVSDDSVNDTTVITISGGSGSGESMWEPDGENNVRPINGKKVNVSHIDGLADVATSADYTDLDNTPETTQTLTDAATITWDSVNGNIAFVTLGDNRIFDNISNPIVGRRYKLYVRQDANGSRLATFSAYYYFPGGIVPTLSASANAVDFFEFECTEAHLFTMVNFVPNIKAQP